MFKQFAIISMLGLAVGSAAADLKDTRTDTDATGASVDGVLSADEYGTGNGYGYTGGGGGFGGTLGSGALYLQSDATNLYVGFQPGGDLNDNVVIMFDTRAGGFTDADMADRADGGRRGSSEQTLNADDSYPILPDFSIVIGNFGIVSFELAAGGDGSLIFKDYNGTFTGNDKNLFREYAIPLSTLGSGAGQNIDFFVAYVSDSSYNSNESIPVSEGLNGGDNPGFDGPSAGYANYDRFVTIPEPSALALLALGGLGLIRRR